MCKNNISLNTTKGLQDFLTEGHMTLLFTDLQELAKQFLGQNGNFGVRMHNFCDQGNSWVCSSSRWWKL